jgi:hypothetical protein
VLLIAIIFAIFRLSAITIDASYLNDETAATIEVMEKKYAAWPKSVGEYNREINGIVIRIIADAVIFPKNNQAIFRIKYLFTRFIFSEKTRPVGSEPY